MEAPISDLMKRILRDKKARKRFIEQIRRNDDFENQNNKIIFAQ